MGRTFSKFTHPVYHRVWYKQEKYIKEFNISTFLLKKTLVRVE